MNDFYFDCEKFQNIMSDFWEFIEDEKNEIPYDLRKELECFAVQIESCYQRIH